MLKIIAGGSLFFISLWGGCYGLSFSPQGEDWWAAPLLATSFVIMFSGVVLFTLGVFDVEGR